MPRYQNQPAQVRARQDRTNAAATVSTRSASGADAIAAQNTRDEEARYQEIYRPVNQDLIAELGENRLLEAAKQEVGNYDPNESAQRVSREMGRVGGQVTAHQAERMADANKLTTAQDTSFTLDNARFSQRTFNDSLRTELINVGRGVSSSGNAGLQDAANSEAARDAANAQASAQAKAGRMQAIGTTIGLAAMFL